MTFNKLYYLATCAYLDARKNERNKNTQIQFEEHLERNLYDLVEELHTRSWRPSPMTWFIIVDPAVREVFSPAFRDRIVSHILFNHMYPIFERYFIYDSYSCRKNKGTFFGIDRFIHHIRSVTDNYQQPGYCLNIDISGYFMSIDRNILYNQINKVLLKPQNFDEDYEFYDYLIRAYLFRDPLEDAQFIGKPSLIPLVPPNKSLFNSPKGVGLPIGDVENQLNSNIYLNPFDQFVHRNLHIKNYGRYVDDARILHKDIHVLEDVKAQCDEFLRNELKLTMHPNKTTITSLDDVNYFLGAAIKPFRTHVVDKTIKRTKKYFKKLNEMCLEEDFDAVEELSHINSYLGYYQHFDEYKFVKKLFDTYTNIGNKYNVARDYSKVAIIKDPQQ